MSWKLLFDFLYLKDHNCFPSKKIGISPPIVNYTVLIQFFTWYRSSQVESRRIAPPLILVIVFCSFLRFCSSKNQFVSSSAYSLEFLRFFLFVSPFEPILNRMLFPDFMFTRWEFSSVHFFVVAQFIIEHLQLHTHASKGCYCSLVRNYLLHSASATLFLIELALES